MRVFLRSTGALYPWMSRRRIVPTVTIRIQRSLSSSAVSSANGVQLYNSKTQRVEPFGVKDSNEAATSSSLQQCVYTCGPTVYAPAHLGHARTYIWLDILRRCLDRYHSSNDATKPLLLWVLNITDVDDKILQEAQRTAVSPLELARRFERAFWRDWDRLHCLRPHVVTRVSEYVTSDILPYIQRLLDQGFAYEIKSDTADDLNEDGIYFDIQALERQTGIQYGVFAPPPPPEAADLRTDASSRKPSRKRDPRDFALWKCKAALDERSLGWASPWGPGRPGWHIECSAMIEAVSRQFGGAPFVLHCGGIDLQFPHHTNEVAQAQAFHWKDAKDHGSSCQHAHVEEWIPHWLHTGHLHIEGRKMSKSLKNFISIHEFLTASEEEEESTSPSPENDSSKASFSELSRADDLRLWVLGLSGSYRWTATYSEERLVEARNVRSKLVRCLLDGEEWMRQQSCRSEHTERWSPKDTAFFNNMQDAVAQCHVALRSDLDGSTYVALMVHIAEESRSYWNDSTNANGPTEPSRFVLQALRDLLSLVGFSDATCRAGLVTATAAADPIQFRSVVEELAQFRAAIRRAAIEDHKNRVTPPTDNMKEILRLCDEYRDTVFPSLGVELLDGKVGREKGTHSTGEGPSHSWRYCVPKGIYRPTTPLRSRSTDVRVLQNMLEAPSRISSKQERTAMIKKHPPTYRPTKPLRFRSTDWSTAKYAGGPSRITSKQERKAMVKKHPPTTAPPISLAEAYPVRIAPPEEYWP